MSSTISIVFISSIIFDDNLLVDMYKGISEAFLCVYTCTASNIRCFKNLICVDNIYVMDF